MLKYVLIVCLLSLIQGCATGLESTDHEFKLYYPSGILKSKWDMAGKKKNGLQQDFDEEGRLISEARFENDLPHGKKSYFTLDGRKWKEEEYRQGKLVAKREFDREGKIVAEENFK